MVAGDRRQGGGSPGSGAVRSRAACRGPWQRRSAAGHPGRRGGCRPPAGAHRSGRNVNVSSDAAVEPYQGWGGYGSSKAALEQLTLVMAAEEGDVTVYVVDH